MKEDAIAMKHGRQNKAEAGQLVCGGVGVHAHTRREGVLQPSWRGSLHSLKDAAILPAGEGTLWGRQGLPVPSWSAGEAHTCWKQMWLLL